MDKLIPSGRIDMEQRIKKILQENFPGIHVDLEHVPGQKITGSVVWDGFNGMDHFSRERKLHQVLRAALGAQICEVGLLLIYSSAELDSLLTA
jgi:acid stress-induced BolA-like protein IbaG/YrbA